MIKYKVIRIEEMDFGCEGVPDDSEICVTLFLEDNNGNTKILKHNDSLLYERNVNEGDTIIILEDNTVKKL
ncbi:MAG: hypothetical protein ACI4VF_08935 [Lachnospirales bacterium]